MRADPANPANSTNSSATDFRRRVTHRLPLSRARLVWLRAAGGARAIVAELKRHGAGDRKAKFVSVQCINTCAIDFQILETSDT